MDFNKLPRTKHSFRHIKNISALRLHLETALLNLKLTRPSLTEKRNSPSSEVIYRPKGHISILHG